jgi:hypothetical protein
MRKICLRSSDAPPRVTSYALFDLAVLQHLFRPLFPFAFAPPRVQCQWNEWLLECYGVHTLLWEHQRPQWQGARAQKICTAGQTLDTRQNRTDTHSVPRPLDESATRGPRRSAGELVRRAAQSSGARGRGRRRGRGGLRPRRPAAAAGLGALEEGRVAARARARADARAHAHLAALRRVELALAHLSVVAGTE